MTNTQALDESRALGCYGAWRDANDYGDLPIDLHRPPRALTEPVGTGLMHRTHINPLLWLRLKIYEAAIIISYFT